MQLVVKLFDEKNVAALKTINDSEDVGTIAFLQQKIKCANIALSPTLAMAGPARHLLEVGNAFLADVAP